MCVCEREGVASLISLSLSCPLLNKPPIPSPSGEDTMSFAEFLELMADIMSQTTRWGNLATKLSGYVGFDTIQEQIRKKSIKRGFELNLMVVGESVVECVSWQWCVCLTSFHTALALLTSILIVIVSLYS